MPKALTLLDCEAGKKGGKCRRKKIQPGELYAYQRQPDGTSLRWHLSCFPSGTPIRVEEAHLGNAPGRHVPHSDQIETCMDPGPHPNCPKHSPTHTDLMVPPESIDAYMKANPLPEEKPRATNPKGETQPKAKRAPAPRGRSKGKPRRR